MILLLYYDCTTTLVYMLVVHAPKAEDFMEVSMAMVRQVVSP